LPDLKVPLGIFFTGWNPRAAETGTSGQIMKLQDITHFFKTTKEE